MNFENIIINLIIFIGIFLISRLIEKRLKNVINNIENKNEYKIKKDLRFATSMGVISLILSIICIVVIFAIFISGGLSRDLSETCLKIFLLSVLLPFPFGLIIVLRDIASKIVNKYSKSNFEIPNITNSIVKVNKLQPKIICITYVFGIVMVVFLQSVVVRNIISNELKAKLSEKYGNNYEILHEWGEGSEGTENSQNILLKVEGLDYPVTGIYHIGSRNYTDDYDEIKNSENDSFHKYIKEIFGRDIITYYRKYKITLIIDQDMLEDVEKFVSNLKLMLQKYYIPECRVYLAIMDKPRENNEFNYKILAKCYAAYYLDNIRKYSYLIRKPAIDIYNIEIKSDNIFCDHGHVTTNTMEFSSRNTLYNIIMEWKQEVM